MARTTSSTSAFLNWPAARRLSTISRMTPSLVVAVNAGTMASRTTKSDMRMVGLSLLARLLGRGGSSGHLAGGQAAAVVLDLFLVAADLLFELVQDLVGRAENVLSTGAGDEVLGVLGLDVELDPLEVLLKID